MHSHSRACSALFLFLCFGLIFLPLTHFVDMGTIKYFFTAPEKKIILSFPDAVKNKKSQRAEPGNFWIFVVLPTHFSIGAGPRFSGATHTHTTQFKAQTEPVQSFSSRLKLKKNTAEREDQRSGHQGRLSSQLCQKSEAKPIVGAKGASFHLASLPTCDCSPNSIELLIILKGF